MTTSSATHVATFADTVARATLRLSPSHARAIASAAERYAMPGTAASRAMMDAVPHDGVRPVAKQLADAWAGAYDASVGRPDGAAVALAIRAAAEAGAVGKAEQTVDIVWTGPSTQQVQPRTTAAVIEELASQSRQRLWVVSFAAYKVPAVVDALHAALERGVSVRLVLETKDESQGALSFDATTAFTKIRDRAAIYVWPHDKRPVMDGGHAAMHAKAVIADETAAFVTSANLTGTALAENMELGLLVRGGPTPRRLALHYQRLVESGVLQQFA